MKLAQSSAVTVNLVICGRIKVFGAVYGTTVFGVSIRPVVNFQ